MAVYADTVISLVKVGALKIIFFFMSQGGKKKTENNLEKERSNPQEAIKKECRLSELADI